MNERFEYTINKIKKQMSFKISFQLIIAILLIALSIYMHFYYEDPFHTNIFIGIIAILLLVTTILMFVMRKKLDWLLENYIDHKQDVIDYLNIYLRNTEYNKNRNFLFKLSQRKEEALYKEAYQTLSGYSLDDEENE